MRSRARYAYGGAWKVGHVLRRLAVACGLALAFVAGGSVGYAVERAVNQPYVARFDRALVEQLQAFDVYPVYWAGSAVVDPSGRPHELVHVLFRDSPAAADGHLPRSRFVSLIYGTCDASSGSCPVPAVIYIEPTCDQPMGRLVESANIGEPFTFRGATGQRTGGGLRIYANGITVSVGTAIKGSTEDNYQFALAVASSLRGINQKGMARVPTAQSDLGAYDPDAPCP